MNGVSISYGNCHRTTASTGCYLQFDFGAIKTSIGAKFNKRFGRDVRGIVDGVEIPPAARVPSYNFECTAKISGRIFDNISFNLDVGKFTRRTGMRANAYFSVAL
jgi:hypothetical protein